MSLDQILNTKTVEFTPHFKPAFLQRDRTVFHFEFEEGEPFELLVEGDTFKFCSLRNETPTLTLYLDNHETCWGLLSGHLDGMQAFMEGRYRADGNIVLSQLLLYLFKMDDPTTAYEVRE